MLSKNNFIKNITIINSIKELQNQETIQQESL